MGDLDFMADSKKKITNNNIAFVTGAPGWLGSQLVETLIKEGRTVRCLVIPGMDETQLKKLGAQTVSGDITKPETLAGKFEGVTTVFHAAGIIHPKRTTSALFRINTQGTANMLAAAAASGVKKFIYISSNSAQGCNLRRDRLMKESDKEYPYLKYGQSKYQAEQLVKSYQKDGRLQTTIIRPCWFYGPGQPDRQTRLMKMVLSGKPLLFGDGLNLRSMTYIDNLISAMLLCDKKAIANGQTYWIADEKPYTTVEIYDTLASLLGVKNMKPRHIPALFPWGARVADRILQFFGLYEMNIHVGGEMTLDIACSVAKAKKELGYRPKVALREGMRRSIVWAKKHGQL